MGFPEPTGFITVIRRSALDPSSTMSTPNPLTPQGSLLEQHGRGKSTFQILSFIAGLHLILLCGVLWIGCKQEDKAPEGSFMAQENAPPVRQAVDPYSSPTMAPTPPPLPPGALGSQPGDATHLIPPSPADIQRPPASGIPSVASGPTSGPSATALPPGSADIMTPAPPRTVVPPVTSTLPPPTGQSSVRVPPPATSTPPSTPPSSSSTSASMTKHKVQRGETGYAIAGRYGIRFQELQAANPSVDWNRLQVNNEIVIPQAGKGGASSAPSAPSASASNGSSGGLEYVVKSGDTGLRIERQFGVPWKEIRRHNRLTSDTIKVGQKLLIPAKSNGSSNNSSARPSAVPLPPTASQSGTANQRR